jgi:hypothetical protein
MSSGDILPALTTMAGLGASVFGAPGVGLPLAASGIGGLFGGGQGGTQAPTTGAQQPNTAQQVGNTLTQVAPAIQQITNAMGLNPQQRPQGAQAPTPATPAMQGSRGMPQGLGIQPMPTPPQAAGAMGNVSAGAGSMTPASSMGGMGGGMNPQLRQILAMMMPGQGY